MSINTANNTLTETKLTYNFYTTPIKSSDSISQNIFMSSESEKKFIKFTNYPYNGKAAHITHDIFGASSSFTITEMRIYQGIYNSADLQLVIETSSTKNEITYVCIPLKQGNDNNSPNDLDKIIQAMCSGNPEECPQKINLNTLINKPKTIDYVIKSSNSRIFNSGTGTQPKAVCIVIFNDDGIKLTATSIEMSQGKIDSSLINTDGSNTSTAEGYKRIKKDNITSPDNLSDANIYIDCTGDEGDGVTQVLGGTYKLAEKDIKVIFYCFFIGLVVTLICYVADNLTTETSGLATIFKWIHKMYYDKSNNLPFINMNIMTFLIVLNFMVCLSLFTSSFFSKTARVQLLISALYFLMTLFWLIYVKFLKNVVTPPGGGSA